MVLYAILRLCQLHKRFPRAVDDRLAGSDKRAPLVDDGHGVARGAAPGPLFVDGGDQVIARAGGTVEGDVDVKRQMDAVVGMGRRGQRGFGQRHDGATVRQPVWATMLRAHGQRHAGVARANLVQRGADPVGEGVGGKRVA